MRGPSEQPKSYKRRLHTAILTSIHAAAGFPEMRVQKLWPNIDWLRIWKNLNDAPVSEDTRCIWYHVIHDIIPTNVRLHRINMIPSDTCRRCTTTDTLEHRLLACGQGRKIWHYTKTLLARMMRTIPTRIPDDWPFRPHFSIWPSQKHRAILWLLANVVIFRMQQQSNLTLQDYMDFLHRTRWKLMRNKDGRTLVGNYLTVLDTN
jgi:hypothetical protein